MKTQYNLHTDKTYMKNTYLIKKDEYGTEVFIIVNGQNIKVAHTYTKKLHTCNVFSFINSIENFVSIEKNYDLETDKIKTTVDFEYNIYMSSNNRDKYMKSTGYTDGFRIVNPEDDNASISIMFDKAEVSGLTYAA